MSTKKLRSDFDGAWKDLIERRLAEILEQFFPKIHCEIDWTRPIEFLDQELLELLPEGSSTERRVDKLVKVFLKNGEEKWLLIHLEVQSFKEEALPERVYHYNHTIHRGWGHEVISLVIFADLNKGWQPCEYRFQQLGCEINFRYPTCKLLDELPRLENDFSMPAIAAKAQIEALRTSRAPQKRFDARWKLVRSLYDHGYSADEIREGYRLLAWMMMLPEDLTLTFRRKTVDFETENEMAYITDTEQSCIDEGIEKGIEKGIDLGALRPVLALLSKRFGTIDAKILKQLEALNADQLEELAVESLEFKSIEDLRRYLKSI